MIAQCHSCASLKTALVMYHMRHTGRCERRGEDWAPLAALYVDKVAILRDILEKQFEEEGLPEGEKRQIQIDLGNTYRRWESGRGRRVDREQIPLSTSQEYADIQLGAQIGWGSWQKMGKAEQRKCMERPKLPVPRRRPLRPITDQLGGWVGGWWGGQRE